LDFGFGSLENFKGSVCTNRFVSVRSESPVCMRYTGLNSLVEFSTLRPLSVRQNENHGFREAQIWLSPVLADFVVIHRIWNERFQTIRDPCAIALEQNRVWRVNRNILFGELFTYTLCLHAFVLFEYHQTSVPLLFQNTYVSTVCYRIKCCLH